MTEQKTNVYNLNIEKSAYEPLGLYSIYDSKTNRYTPPFFAKSEKEAIRNVTDIVNYKQGLINSFPSDYTLYYVAAFNEVTGQIHCFDHPVIVTNCSELVTNDTIKFDNLKQEVQKQQFAITGALKEFDDKVALYEKKLRELTVLEDKLKAKYQGSAELPDFNKNLSKKLSLKKKSSFLEKLFN